MKRYGPGILSAAVLLLSFAFCRFALFECHGMKSWPAVLLLAGGAAIGVSVLFKRRLLPFFAALGYPLSFLLGAVFGRDFADPTGAMTLNTMWSIWTAAYLFIICAGIAAEAGRHFAAKKAAGRGGR